MAERLSPDLAPIMTEHREASMFGLCIISASVRLQDGRPGNRGSSDKDTDFRLCPQHSNQLCVSTSLAPHNFLLRAMTLTIHFHLTPGVRKRGIIHILPDVVFHWPLQLSG